MTAARGRGWLGLRSATEPGAGTSRPLESAPGVTVVIASYRYAHLAAQAIESVLAQTRPPERILVVDDAAHDGVDRVCALYEVECLVRRRNLGTAANFDDLLRNHVGTSRALFLGADNWLRSDALERMLAADADIVSSDIALFGTEVASFIARRRMQDQVAWIDGHWIWRFEPGNIETGNYIHGSSLYNADMARRFGYRRSGEKNPEEDWMLWKAMLGAGARHVHVPEPLLFYRRHRKNFIRT